MTLMWVALITMAVVGALTVILPLLTHRPRHELSANLINAAVFRDRLAELQLDLEQGRIEQAEYEQLKQELELTLLSDVDQPETKLSNSGKWMAIPLLVLVPVAAVFVYWTEGYRNELKDWFVTQERLVNLVPQIMAGNYDAAQKGGVTIPDFIRMLQRQLQSSPDDARGWYLLGASYLQSQMPEQAELAFSRAASLDPTNADYIMGYTQANLALNNGTLTPQIRGTLEQIMQVQPDNPKPYMTMGMALFQGGDFQAAIEIWQRYTQRPDANPQAVQLLERSIDVAREQLAKADSTTQPVEQVAGAAGPQLVVTVNVSDTVKAGLQASDVLFVYAKAQSGPPMPLAVVRQPVGGWPVTVTLSDANAMTPAMSLSKFKNVQVLARVSPSGNAISQPGDWIAAPVAMELAAGQQSVTLTINSRKP